MKTVIQSKKVIFLLTVVTASILNASPLTSAESTTFKQEIVSILQRKEIPEELIVILVSTLPILELRAGIPLSLYTFDMSFLRSYILSVIGNLIPIIPLLLFLTRLARILSRYKPFDKLFSHLFSLARRRGGLIEKYEALGLILFVAIPLPVTGAWTGAVASVLFGLRFRYALPSICLGVLTAGLIVSGTCWLGINLFS